jgi:SpoVK/Ycf46/Vps4 family AAA+-type ATPase
MNELRHLLKAKIQCIWIDTYEEGEVVKDLRQIASDSSVQLFTWTQTEGLKKIALTNHEKQEDPNPKINVDGIFHTISEAQDDKTKDNSGLYVLKDLHMLIDNPNIKRYIRDIKERPSKNYNPIIVVSPVVCIPIELEKLFTVLHYDTPSKTEITRLVEKMTNSMRKNNEEQKKGYVIPTADESRKIVTAFIGLTYKEIADTMAKSIVKYNTLSLNAILEEKIQLVEKSGVLDYQIPNVCFTDVGGNQAFKQWISEVESAMTDDARDFGCAMPKGYLALGVPGTAKTFLAEAIATKWGVPMLSLNMSKIMNKLVGESEKKIDQAFRIAKACAPCVLLFDEVEKALSGTRSSNASDAGTTSRVFSTVLKFLNDNNNGVYVVMTSNDVTQLPPELTRSGRLDAMWYFSLPTEEERKDIFRIHLGKTGKTITDDVINAAAKATENYTGAEIKDIVKQAMWKAFKRFKTGGENGLTEEDVVSAAKEVIPIFRSSEEKIQALEYWARGRARYTNGRTESEQHSDDELTDDILDELK